MMGRSIQVLYFSSLKEQLGKESEAIDLPEPISDIQGLREWICARGEPWAEKFNSNQKLMAAVNQEMAKPDTSVADGDEIAFFPPVTGG